MNIKSGIYKIRNITNEKCYIGSAVDFDKRWGSHKHNLKEGHHHNRHLQSAWNKHGKESFVFEILEKCDKAKLIEREQYYFDELKPEYNVCPSAGSHLGMKASAETKRKIGLASSKRLKGKKHFNYGKNLSDETKRKISETLKGTTASDETKRKLSKMRKGPGNSFYGKKHSKESREKMSLAMKGRIPWNKKVIV